jgi:5-formyltetrahydrofolate cyclo-ligase
MPGLAFTKSGKRLGRGKGYYDRFLAKCFRKLEKRPFTLGLAFREQIVSDIPTTDTDVIIDQVLHADN